MRILSFLFALLLVILHGAAVFSRPPVMQCGYRGTFCIPGICPRGNIYLGVCCSGHSCCKW
ncbi:gallinacin-4-like isoform X1 [Apus apus]|uniref:gallinacin-4-like isoform X1 n=1 Tax=Apus apus TaxID=8895 RepID=UPI0021F87099|nr:gallinacin-4-like isoform X1 [Apus apus]